jgi:hypothetical protein
MNAETIGPIAGIAFAIVFVFLVMGLVVALNWTTDKKLHRGIGFMRRRAIRQAGRRVQATIIDVQYKTILGANDMVLELEPPSGARYRVECAEVISLAENHFTLTGHKIMVFVDPIDPKTVVVDLVELRNRVRQGNVEDQEKHARMLRGG